MAVVFFRQSTGRNSYGGYLVSDSTNQWLLDNAPMVLTGYPVQGVPDENVGKMHSTQPQPISFHLSFGNVFESTQLRSFQGNCGGPVCVKHTNGFFYPAGIYLGQSETGSAVVRSIDPWVVDLISRAAYAVETSTNYGTGSSVRIWPGPISPNCISNITISIEPASARELGAAWRLTTNPNFSDALKAWSTNSAAVQLDLGPFSIEFQGVEGFFSPNQPDWQLECTSPSNFVFTYEQIIPYLGVDNFTNLYLAGATNTRYRVEYTSTLEPTNAWTPFSTITCPPYHERVILSNALGPGLSTRFYRAIRLP